MIPEDQRVMPETRPDSEAAGHRILCECPVCKRPAAAKVKRRAREAAIRRGELPAPAETHR